MSRVSRMAAWSRGHAMQEQIMRLNTIAVFFSVFVLLVPVPATSGEVKFSDVATRVEKTLQGVFQYYWQHDPRAKNIGFFFACGQIGAVGTSDWNTCSCNTRDACVDCYRWWDAVLLESVATHGIYTNTKTNASIADTIFAHSPYNAEWNASKDCTFMDDFSWYGIAYLRVYEWLKNPKWLNRSVAIYNWTWHYGWDDDCGGFWWNTCPDNRYKDSITNVEVLHLGSKLSYLFPNESWYLDSAERIWEWFFSFDDGYGLMSDQYLVSTGAVPEKCCNSTTLNPFSKCINSKISGTSYNQGLLLSASAFLYRRTGNQTYLDVGMRALEAILTNYTTKEGILIDEPRSYQSYEDQCMTQEDPGGDWYSFQGIFMAHLGYFTELLTEKGSLSKEIIDRIKNLVEQTSNAAWNRSAVWPPFDNSDACNTGVSNQNLSSPKFHWWWGKNVTEQIIPPDPGIFFHKNQLRCIGNDTQLWEGMLGSEDKCMEKCFRNSSCSKYLYQTDQASVPGTDCWIWSYNRSDHSCPQSDYDFNVGIKRPVGQVSCAGHCDSEKPLQLKHGVCYCDSNCVKHLDCCLDYADFCLPREPPTCKGLCDVVQPRAIRGGGYCWCMSGCTEGYTDNNSYGSCCPDYKAQCEQLSMPTCLDVRSQGSALNLFLAHLRLLKVTD